MMLWGGLNKYAKIGIIVCAVLALLGGVYYLFSGVRDNGGGAERIRYEIDNASRGQQDITDAANNIKSGLDDSQDRARAIGERADAISADLDRITGGSGTIDEILQRDARIIEESRGIIERIRARGAEPRP